MIQFVKQLTNDQSRRLKGYQRRVDRINQLETTMQALSDEEMRTYTETLKATIANGGKVDDVAEEAFALVREAAVRVLNMRHYDVQLIGGFALLEGNISEMPTGEGKTLVAALPSYVKALEGKGVHVITVNEYLATRDAHQIGQIHEFLGLTVGLNVPEMDQADKLVAYQADITYGVGTEFGFDYLRDHLVGSPEERVQRPFHFAIIDEVDSILIDEAKTPLIIAQKDRSHIRLKELAQRVVTELDETDYEVDLESKSAAFTDSGILKIEDMFAVDNLFGAEHQVLYHYLVQALRANVLFELDVDYIVQEDKIELIDLFTGRIMEGRSLSEGLHQALEAKEGVTITEENKTTAEITIQHYFRMYPLIGGMTGTAQTSRQEFLKTYNMDVVQVPTNRERIRLDHPDRIFMTIDQKYAAVTEKVVELHETGRPILIGTTSIAQSEAISKHLTKRRIQHDVLNAKTVTQEADIIADAGHFGKVTIATNMAGRGTDIMLDEKSKQAGGLFVIGTERHESQRVDNQLRGRSGRQGDPGETQFFVSLEDEIVKRYANKKLERIEKKLKPTEQGEIFTKDASDVIEYAQTTIEGLGVSIRDYLFKLDDVLNEQRKIIYTIRDQAVNADASAITHNVLGMMRLALENTIDMHTSDELVPEEWPLDELKSDLVYLTTREPVWTNEIADSAELKAELKPWMDDIVATAESRLQAEEVVTFVKESLLRALDGKWTDHLTTMSGLKEGIGLRSYAQEDPSRQFGKEGFEIFEQTYVNIAREVTTEVCQLDQYFVTQMEEE
ncbi:accessory Sec system translocase SecA2 [Exiguobacterium sp. AM39-5BH]|uniref:accessory Sec system translocase SecA2 n=1 Tax=Exiguobacterium sp. AM39-5BH TaxID=2292355 RepID=UPI000FE23FC6|nr:accessory Sec system translocase SecA2 [Exiguobacterium sp. AM39-5BH]RHB51625.1 accessory Sec system translocase SecA2 [Exiguobacterium sp. AM39-5BH]